MCSLYAMLDVSGRAANRRSIPDQLVRLLFPARVSSSLFQGTIEQTKPQELFDV